MPWPPKQRKAIAADLQRKGKSSEEISKFFREHGHGAERKRRNRRGAQNLMKATRSKGS